MTGFVQPDPPETMRVLADFTGLHAQADADRLRELARQRAEDEESGEQLP
jgi:hypothetical protein